MKISITRQINLFVSLCLLGMLFALSACEEKDIGTSTTPGISTQKGAIRKASQNHSYSRIPAIIDTVLKKQEAMMMMKKSAFPDGLADFKKSLESTPANMWNKVMLALMHTTSFELRKAIHCYLEAHSLDPNAAEPLIGLGKVYYSLAIGELVSRKETPQAAEAALKEIKRILLLAKEMLEQSKALNKIVRPTPDGSIIGLFGPDEPDATLERVDSYLSKIIAHEIDATLTDTLPTKTISNESKNH